MLFNSTKRKNIIERVRIADSFFKRFRGLMLADRKKSNFALVFPLESESRMNASIHMMFMRFPIDVLWLDAHRKVVDKREALKPWALNASPKKPAKFIVELPEGKAEGTNVGDSLVW